jgi:cardiolipin synthase
VSGSISGFEIADFITLGLLVVQFIISVAMLIYVPRKRSPAASRTWLILVFFQPFIGAILYFLVGRIYVSARRLKMQHEITRIINKFRSHFLKQLPSLDPQLDDVSKQAILLAQQIGDFSAIPCNAAELLTDYDGTITRLVQDIDQAQDHVHLLYYIFADDAVGGRVIGALGRAVERGVTCRVLLDSFGSKKWRKHVLRKMQALGIEARVVLPPGNLLRRGAARFDLRNHRKIVVVDGATGYIGSQNLVDSGFKQGIVYEELVARVTGPVVAQLQAIFLSDYYLETARALTPVAYPGLLPAFEMNGTVTMQTLPSGPGYSSGTTERLIVALLYRASKRVVLTTPYFVPESPLLEAMATAVKCGVDVHLIVSRAADQLLVSLAQKSYYEELLEDGIHIHLYEPAFLHAKHLTIDDDIALIGSSNIDIRSFSLNEEVSVIMYDAGIVEQLRAIQDDYIAGSHLLTLAEWRARPLHQQVSQNLARLFDSFL